MNLESLQQENEHQARRLLRELGRPTDLEQAESLRLRADEPAIIRGLGQKFAELRGQADEARRTIARHDEQIKSREIELSELEQPTDIDALRRAVRQARKAGDLESRLVSGARSSWSVHKKTGQRPWPSLPAGTARPMSFGIWPFPWARPWINSKAVSWNCRDAGRRLPSRCPRKRNRSASVRAACTPSRYSKTCPARKPFLQLAGEEKMVGGWCKPPGSRVHEDGEDLAAFLAEFAPAGTLAEAYAQSVKHADVLADRLRREADRVARKAELQAALERHRANCAELEHDLKLLEDRHTALEEDWKALVAPLGINAQRWTPH